MLPAYLGAFEVRESSLPRHVFLVFKKIPPWQGGWGGARNNGVCSHIASRIQEELSILIPNFPWRKREETRDFPLPK